MIIKSMSRKEPSFGALMAYIDRELGSEAFRVRHNLFSRETDRTRQEFEENAALLRKRKNGVFLYHEILSITRAKGLSAKKQQELLSQIVQHYIDARCPGCLVYGGLHQDKDHSYHFHLMISSNGVGESKRHRLSKAQFREIQVKLEEHVLEHFPQLEQKLAIGKRADLRRSKGAVEHERRTGRPPSRQESLLGRLRAAYEASRDRESLQAALGSQGFRHEPRGKTFARVIDEYSTKAHRLKTLDPDLASLIEKRLSESEKQAEQQSEAKPEPKTENGRASRGADEKEKTGERGADYGRSRAEARAEMDREKHSEPEAEERDEMEDEGPQTSGPVENQKRKEKIDRGEIEPDPAIDIMSHEDWYKQDRFSHKFAASWRRTIDELREASGPSRERDGDEPER